MRVAYYIVVKGQKQEAGKQALYYGDSMHGGN